MRVAPLLRRKKMAVPGGATIFKIWKTCDPDHTAAVWEFAKVWLTPKNQASLLSETGHSPATQAGYEHPIGERCLKKWPDFEVFRNAYKHADETAGIHNYPTMALEYLGIRRFVYRMIMGKLSSDEAVQQMQTKCQSILEEF